MTGLSLRTLASKLDDLAAAGSLVHESVDGLVISQLSAQSAQQAAHVLMEHGWPVVVRDGADTELDAADATPAFGPFRLSTQKPAGERPVILTATGFRDWLETEESASVVTVVGLTSEIRTESVLFLPEGTSASQYDPGAPIRSPRSTVREYASTRLAPVSIGRWLMTLSSLPQTPDDRFVMWASSATRSLMLSLANEIDHHGAMVFKGPPRLSVPVPALGTSLFDDLGPASFLDLQAAARWVYELDREVDNRHTLFATEFARTGGTAASAAVCFRENAGVALEGAKIAHQMAVSKVSAENLKALADLRKAVTDETGKLTDAARQVVTAVATALGVGIGLIAARATSNAPGWLVISVMIVIGVYMFAVIYSGQRFAELQRGLRDVWRGQIYRFLSQDEYQNLVVQPGRDAEHVFKVVSWAGGITVAVLLVVALFAAVLPVNEWIAAPAMSQSSTGLPSPADAPMPVTPDAPSDAGSAPLATPPALQPAAPTPESGEQIEPTVPPSATDVGAGT